MVPKFRNCRSCYFFDREPAICEDCHTGENFEQKELDEEGLDELREITFFRNFKDAA